MLIDKEKTIINSNVVIEGYFLLEQRLKLIVEQHYPYIELVIEEEQLIDIIPIERPDSTPTEAAFEELQLEQNVDFDYRLSLLEMGLI